jgi:hypothetical protein
MRQPRRQQGKSSRLDSGAKKLATDYAEIVLGKGAAAAAAGTEVACLQVNQCRIRVATKACSF